ncbi:carbohydrate kinase family protein [Pseudonocardia acaciae]|uniref:carbohydrate kinase family protein n=1 Tax=Pseudonocardia acaciae TaxID=551276 RepID=UPI00048E3257|nr:PfkB family carbohydrate kinase [Pseudonocardia acaciae]
MTDLAVLGDLVEDVVVWLRGPLRAGTDNPASVHRTRGGSAANVAMFAAPLVSTRFIGRVGEDPLGCALVERLRASGVDVRVQRGGRTGSIVVLVHPDGERTMLPDRGASAELAPVPAGWLDGVRYLHVPGYAFAAEPAASSAYGLIKSASCAVTMDASSTALLDEYGPARFRELVADVRPAVLFANAAEARALRLGDHEPPAGTLFVIKNGAGPTTVRGAGTPPIRVPVPTRGRARDTTGAGDAFAAGYLASAAGGADPRTAVEAGHRLAARVLDAPGASFASPSLEAT